MGYEQLSNNSTNGSTASPEAPAALALQPRDARPRQHCSPLPTPYLTVKAAAEVMDYSEMTIYRAINDGSLHVSQRGKGCHIRIPVTELYRVFGAKPRFQTVDRHTGDERNESGIQPGRGAVATTSASGSSSPAGSTQASDPVFETSNSHSTGASSAPAGGAGAGPSTSGIRVRKGPPPRWMKTIGTNSCPHL